MDIFYAVAIICQVLNVEQVRLRLEMHQCCPLRQAIGN
jgi:hypothetical protein